jgi:hypothetical protein
MAPLRFGPGFFEWAPYQRRRAIKSKRLPRRTGTESKGRARCDGMISAASSEGTGAHSRGRGHASPNATVGGEELALRASSSVSLNSWMVSRTVCCQHLRYRKGRGIVAY